MGSLGRIPNVVIWLSSLWETLMMLQRKTNFSGLTDGTFCLSTCFQIYVHSYRSVHARMHIWLHQILAAHFANVLQMHISYKYLFHTPKPFCTIFPLGTSPSFLPLDCGSFPRTSTKLRQMPSGIIRLRQPSSACLRSLTQCKCLVQNTTPAALKHQHHCAVSFVSRRTTAEKTIPHSHSPFAALLCTWGIVGQETEETIRWEKEQEGWEGKQGKRKAWRGQNDFASCNKTI